MKKPVYLFLSLILIIILCWGLLNYFILSGVINKLQNSLSVSSNYKIKIEKPRYHFTGVEIPEIRLFTPQGELKAQSLKLRLIPYTLLKFQPHLQGKTVLVIDRQKIDIETINISYSLKTKEVKSEFYIPESRWEDILRLITIFNYEIPQNLKIAGKCSWRLTMRWKKNMPFTLKITGKTSHPDIFYGATKFKPQNANFNLNLRNRSYIVDINGGNISIYNKNKKIIWAKNIKIKGNNSRINLVIQSGNLITHHFAANFDFIPQTKHLEYQLQIEDITIKGKAYKYQDEIKTQGEVDKILVTGSYNHKDNKLILNASGITELNKISSFLNNKVLSLVSGTINLKNLVMIIAPHIVKANINSEITNLNYHHKIIAENGKLDIEIKNDNLVVKKIELHPQNGEILITGNLDLKQPYKFSGQIIVDSLALERFISIFTTKDIGNAYVFAQGVFNGYLQNIKSTTVQLNWRFENGNLGKIKFLDQLGQLLNNPNLGTINFHTGKGRFILRNHNIFIPQAVFISPMLNLYLQGKITLLGKLDLMVITEFAESSKQLKSSPWEVLQEFILQGVSQLAYKIIITGTIDKPQYTIIPAVVDNLLKNFAPPVQ